MKKYLFFALLVFAQLLLWSSCKHKCEYSVPPKVTFTLNQEVEKKLYLINSGDTVTKGFVTFVANIDNIAILSLDWKIGTDSRTFKEQKFELDFDVTGTIPVQLIARRRPDTECFPFDDGIDTIYQVFNIVDTTLIMGRYRGFSKSNPSSFLILRS